ncbi:hypothetical protein CMV_011856 [Castanea mollissima]|uniref:Uncharacterized protein n=1 Tax=Castanea mollissima TaxID=60419 RepID=A0A8J4RGK6_9ROSI|nr:hypothetical protein CMV_011856 [Castanea mollissima]
MIIFDQPLGKRLYIQAKIGGKWPILLASLDLIGFQKDDLVQQYYRVLKSLAYDNRQELVIPQRELVLQLCKSLIVRVSSNHTGNGNSLQLQKDILVGEDEDCSLFLRLEMEYLRYVLPWVTLIQEASFDKKIVDC